MTKKQKLSTLALLLLLAATLHAAPRSKAQMRAIAAQALSACAQASRARGGQPVEVAQLSELRQLGNCSLIGYQGGSFAVVSASDLAPALLGVCTTGVSGGLNPEFEWWLQAMNSALAELERRGVSAETTLPDPARFPTSVAPMVTTHWGQEEPYNQLTPTSQSGKHCMTGCVATSIAQVANYHRMPLRGQGQETIYYPQRDVTGTPVYANFGATYYDFEHTRDDYRGQDYTDEEAQAVALLMRHAGVVADMNYATNGSGANSENACKRLSRYFGFSDAVYKERDDYSEPEWMNMIYEQLSLYGPIVYDGHDNNVGGHSFVIHGYREDGMVWVNWGWEGGSDGYYNIALLNPSSQRFSEWQGMMLGIKGDARRREHRQLADCTVALATAGALASQLPADAVNTLGSLTISGPLNGADVKTLRELATTGLLHTVDLTEATIVEGGGTYYTSGRTRYSTKADELPALLFKDSPWLTTVRLPRGLKTYGDGALAACPNLRTVELPVGAESQFVVDDGVVYSPDRTELIAVLSPVVGRLSIAPTVTNIHAYAASGCVGLDTLEIPASVATIGAEAFKGCGGLTLLRSRIKAPFTPGSDAMAGIHADWCKLLVPAGTQSLYARLGGWQTFTDVEEFGTAIRANDATRAVGQPNPVFSYSISGDIVSGEPELYTDATVDSPAGTYTIYVRPGTITAPDVDYIEGRLIVRDADPSAVDAPRLAASSVPFDVYSPSGVLLRRGVTSLSGLPAGVYVVNGRKQVVN